MYPRRMLFFVVAALLAVLVFGTIISNVQRDAWTQGYLMGQLAANAGDGKAAPVAPFGYPGYGAVGPYGPYGAYGGPHFSPFGLLFLLGFGFLAFMAFNRHRMWRAWMSQQGQGQGQPGEPGAAAGGPWGGPWGRHGHRPPPWWGWDSVPPSRGSETPAEAGSNPANGESGQA